MKLLQIVLVLSLMVLLIWYALTVKRKPGIILMTDGAFFKRNKILIRYSNVVKIEEDIFLLGGSKSTVASYVITYVSGVGDIDSVRFYLKYADKQNWKVFKERVRFGNPEVKFDDSIF